MPRPHIVLTFWLAWAEQVWEVRLWKKPAEEGGKGPLLASSRVTLVANLPVPEEARDAAEKLRKHAKL